VKRISQNRDLFESTAGETITLTVEAIKTPFQVTFSDLGSGSQWTPLQQPTPGQPVEQRQFTMPNDPREFFDIIYGFPPSDQMKDGAKYLISLSGGGTTDGPNGVFPPFVGNITDLFYEFRLPKTAPGTAVAFMARGTNRSPAKSKRTTAKPGRRVG
jgi:hypothetical protein